MRDNLIVFVQPVPKKGANGDRDTRPPTPYNDYKIHVATSESELSQATEILLVNGYDNFNSSINNRSATHASALRFAENLHSALGIKTPVRMLEAPTHVIRMIMCDCTAADVCPQGKTGPSRKCEIKVREKIV